jgi:hypothetical protein
MCLRVSYKKKYEENKKFCILKITEERSRIRSWIRILSRIPNTGDTHTVYHDSNANPQPCFFNDCSLLKCLVVQDKHLAECYWKEFHN